MIEIDRFYKIRNTISDKPNTYYYAFKDEFGRDEIIRIYEDSTPQDLGMKNNNELMENEYNLIYVFQPHKSIKKTPKPVDTVTWNDDSTVTINVGDSNSITYTPPFKSGALVLFKICKMGGTQIHATIKDVITPQKYCILVEGEQHERMVTDLQLCYLPIID